MSALDWRSNSATFVKLLCRVRMRLDCAKMILSATIWLILLSIGSNLRSVFCRHGIDQETRSNLFCHHSIPARTSIIPTPKFATKWMLLLSGLWSDCWNNSDCNATSRYIVWWWCYTHCFKMISTIPKSPTSCNQRSTLWAFGMLECFYSKLIPLLITFYSNILSNSWNLHPKCETSLLLAWHTSWLMLPRVEAELVWPRTDLPGRVNLGSGRASSHMGRFAVRLFAWFAEP